MRNAVIYTVHISFKENKREKRFLGDKKKIKQSKQTEMCAISFIYTVIESYIFKDI